MTNKKENREEVFRIILNYFPYFIFLIVTEPKEIFTSQKIKEGKKGKEWRKGIFFLWTLHDFFCMRFCFLSLSLWLIFQEFLIIFLLSHLKKILTPKKWRKKKINEEKWILFKKYLYMLASIFYFTASQISFIAFFNELFAFLSLY
jgi:hypothetical protein